jgi:transcriptional regulator with XRE-family HTH domain
MSEVVALLLDDAMPPERLGALLRAARKRRGMTRKQASAVAGTTAVKLRRYERGDKQVPPAVCARLAECYGDDLTAHVPLRVPPQIGEHAIVVGGEERTVGPDPDDVIAGFVDIVQRLRDAEPGEPLALRATDVVALAGALGRDRDEIERRIADALGCSQTVARTLHAELLRRKVILPVAGLAAGIAAFAGAAYTAHTPASGARIQTSTIDAGASPTTAPVQPEKAAAHPTAHPTTSTTAEPPPTTTAPPAVRVEAPPVTPTTEPRTDATVPADQQTADVPATLAPPQPDPNDPPVSILPGETPITIIGTATQASEGPTTP